MAKVIWKAFPEYMRMTSSICLSESYFSCQWTMVMFIVLLKSPDKVRSCSSAYRGIHLLPVLGEVLEKVMVERLVETSS